MKRILTFLVLACAAALAQTGTISNATINGTNMNGSDMYVTIAGFTRGGTFNWGLTGNNQPTAPTFVVTVTGRSGYTTSGTAVTNLTATVIGTDYVRYNFPPAYANSHSYVCGNRVAGSAHDQYETVASCTSATTGTPAWSTSGGTVSDNTCSWLDAGASPIPAVVPGIPDANTCTSGQVTFRISLSEYVYSGETATLSVANTWYHDNGSGGTGNFNLTATNIAVTNNSTLAYPVSICRNATVPYQLVSAAFTVEAFCASRFARNGSEVAAMVFTVSDAHSHSNTTTVNQMTKSSWGYGDPNTVTDYSALMSVAGLTNGDVLTVTFIAYPWVGNSGSLVNSTVGQQGFSQPSGKLGPLYFQLDTNSSFTGTCAIVDTTNGVTSPSPLAYATCAAAESAYNGNHALSYNTLPHATAGLKSFNNTTYGSGHNDAGCSTLEYPAGTGYTLTDSGSSLGTMNCWLTITHISTATSQTGVTFTTGGALLGQYYHVQDVSLVATSGVSFVTGSATVDSVWLDHDILNMQMTAPIYQNLAVYATQNLVPVGGSMTGGFFPFSNTTIYFPLIRGNFIGSAFSSGQNSCAVHAVLGNYGCNPVSYDIGNTPGVPTTDLPVIAFNSLYGINTQTGVWAGNSVVTGWALVQNLMENTSGGTPLTSFAADGSGENAACNDGTNFTLCPVNNVVMQHNTFVGERANIGYNEFDVNGGTEGNAGSPYDNNPRIQWSLKFNIFSSQGTDACFNNKVDTFVTGPPNGNRLNAWPVNYMIGGVGNVCTPTQIQFPADFPGLGGAWYQSLSTLAFVNNKSASGTATGHGNYNIGATSIAVAPCITCTAADEVIPFDIRGTPRLGIPNAGAYTFWQGLVINPNIVIFPNTVVYP